MTAMTAPTLPQAIAAEHARQEAEHGEPLSRADVVVTLIWSGLLREAERRVREKEEQIAQVAPPASLRGLESLRLAVIEAVGSDERMRESGLAAKWEAFERGLSAEHPAVSLLREIEWSGPEDLTALEAACLFCLRQEPAGHRDDCKLAALIKERT